MRRDDGLCKLAKRMKFMAEPLNVRAYAAPMEGLTGYVFRKAHHACFPCTDLYFTPFITPDQHHRFSSRDLKEVSYENNAGVPVVPQILTRNADDFLWAAGQLSDMGYDTVNLNLGCPAPTVVTRGKGSGLLGSPDALKAFLDAIFDRSPLKISIKTRIGLSSDEYWPKLIELFNQYPLPELIIHPRLQADMYSGPVRTDAFELAFKQSVHPLVYNGNLCQTGQMQALCDSHPGLYGLMCGRGLLAAPHLICRYKGIPLPDGNAIYEFHNRVFEGYTQSLPDNRAILFKMKELWHYLAACFPDRGNFDKRLKKVVRISDYTSLVQQLFDICPVNYAITDVQKPLTDPLSPADTRQRKMSK